MATTTSRSATASAELIPSRITPSCQLPSSWSPPPSCSIVWSASLRSYEGLSYTTSYGTFYRFNGDEKTTVLIGDGEGVKSTLTPPVSSQIPCLPGGMNMEYCNWALRPHQPTGATPTPTCPGGYNGISTVIRDEVTRVVCCPAHPNLTIVSSSVRSQYLGLSLGRVTSTMYQCEGVDQGPVTTASNDVTITYYDNRTRTAEVYSASYWAQGFAVVYNASERDNPALPIPEPIDEEGGGGGGGLRTGAKAGIGVGIAVVALLVAGLATWFFLRRRKRNQGRKGVSAATGNEGGSAAEKSAMLGAAGAGAGAGTGVVAASGGQQWERAELANDVVPKTGANELDSRELHNGEHETQHPHSHPVPSETHDAPPPVNYATRPQVHEMPPAGAQVHEMPHSASGVRPGVQELPGN